VQLLAEDHFHQGLQRWRLEAQDPRSLVTAEAGVLDVQAPAGLSLWWRAPLQGDVALGFSATPLPAPASAGPLAGRVSDLNMFWHASEADGQPPRPRDGAFASYDSLRAFYVGFGANGNTTTRLRRYDGTGLRTLLDGWADGAEASPADRQGPMQAHTRLQVGEAVQVWLVSRQPTADDPVVGRWWVNGRLLFALQASSVTGAWPQQGHFALRTTASRWQFRHFQVLACQRVAGALPTPPGVVSPSVPNTLPTNLPANPP
jgi:hypothetical protein